MPKVSLRARVGLGKAKHRRRRTSRSVVAVVIAAALLIVLGIVFTVVHRPKSAPTANRPLIRSHPNIPATTTSLAPLPSSTTSTTSTTSTSSTTTTTTPTPSTLPPTQVLVEVLNGSGVSGQATAVAAALQRVGFGVNGTGDATSYDHSANVIEYPPGDEQEAVTLEGYLSGTTTLLESSSAPSGAVQLVIGSSYDGLTRS